MSAKFKSWEIFTSTLHTFSFLEMTAVLVFVSHKLDERNACVYIKLCAFEKWWEVTKLNLCAEKEGRQEPTLFYSVYG